LFINAKQPRKKEPVRAREIGTRASRGVSNDSEAGFRVENGEKSRKRDAASLVCLFSVRAKRDCERGCEMRSAMFIVAARSAHNEGFLTRNARKGELHESESADSTELMIESNQRLCVPFIFGIAAGIRDSARSNAIVVSLQDRVT